MRRESHHEAASLPESCWVTDTQHLSQSPAARVPLAEIKPGDSPRRSGVDLAHARRIAASEDPLPPIMVNRGTMRVIDGMHRLNAAKIRGQEFIDVTFLEADEASAFVIAVRANIMHGLPLSLPDRKAAASRILGIYPQWSNRAVAHVSGLAPNTIAQLRSRLTEQNEQLDTRVGIDGRKRPINGEERRCLAAQLIRDNPDASLRVIAHHAGISPETARTVRAQVSNENGAPSARHGPNAQATGHHVQLVSVRSSEQMLRALAADPAIRSKELGRMLLQALAASHFLDDSGAQLAETLPDYRLGDIILASQACMNTWRRFAQRLEQHRARQADQTGSLFLQRRASPS